MPKTIYDQLPEYQDQTTEATLPGENGQDVPAGSIYDQLPNGFGEGPIPDEWVPGAKQDRQKAADFFRQEVDFRGFPDDFLIINDVVISGIPTTAVSIESSNDVVVAETLRSRSPVVSTKGTQSIMVNISLVFPPGQEQSYKLRRLISELQHHPLLYVYNGKIRKSLNIVDPSENTIFVLETATMRSDSEHTGSIILDMTLHYFNYKPFSHHFWYNTELPWTKPTKEQAGDDTEPNELYLGDLIGYEASSHSMDRESEKMARDLYNGTIALFGEKPNAPVNMPMASKSWMYYASHMYMKTWAVKETTSDYVGIHLRQYEYRTPDSDEARAGRGAIKDIFREVTEDDLPKFNYHYKSQVDIPKEQYADLTATERQAHHAIDKEHAPPPKPTGIDWLDTRNELVSTYGISVFAVKNGLTPGVLSPVLANADGSYRSFQNASKCNIHFFEVLYRSGYEVSVVKTKYGKGYPQIGGMLRQIRSPRLKWGIRISTKTKSQINKIIQTGVPCGLLNNFHVVILTKVHEVEHASDGRITRIRFAGYDQKKLGEYKSWTWTDKKTPGGLEIVQAIPSGTRPPYRNPLGPIKKKDAVVEFVNKVNKAETKQTGGKQDGKILKDNRSATKRMNWIKKIYFNEGLEYYTDDQKVRNVFFRDISCHVSSDPINVELINRQNIVIAEDMVTSAVSVTFGNRLAKQKLLSQDTHTWQFLGAGNKTGTLVFTFAGDTGRRSADNIKKIIYESRRNARKFGSVIPDAGTIKLSWEAPDGRQSPNTILALFAGRTGEHPQKDMSVIVTDFSEQSDPNNSDLHQLVVNFIVQDFAEEKLDRNVFTSLDQKKRVLSVIMDKFVSSGWVTPQEDYEDKDKLEEDGRLWFVAANPEYILYRDTKTVREEYLIQKHVEGTGVVGGGARPFKIVGNKIPAWLAPIIIEAVAYTVRANDKLPRWDTTIFDTFAAERHMKGYRDNNETKRLPGRSSSGPAGNVTHPGEEVNDREANNRLVDQIFNEWSTNMDIVFQKIMQHATASDFKNHFGEIGDELVDALVSQMGECYDDLMLPPTPEYNVPLPPDFYVYDDSHEDPALSTLTDDGNIELLLRQHLRNERKSVARYLEDYTLGGSYMSRNVEFIKSTRDHYVSQMDNEIKFINFSQMLAEGCSTWEPVFYRNTDPVYNEATVKKWTDHVLSKGGGSEDESRQTFMENLVKLSPYLGGEARHWMADKDQPYSEVVNQIYEENWKRLAFGPNPDYQAADTVMNGNPIDPQAEASRQAIKKTESEEQAEAQQNAETYGPHQTKMEDGSITFGQSQNERDAAGSGIGGAIMEALGTVGSFFLATAEATNPVISLASKGISALVQTMNHEDVKNVFKEENEDNVRSKTAASTALGTKWKDLSIRRVFPTFKIYFIEDDESGTEILQGRTIRAFDDFYSYSAVQEIRVIRSRKVAADLAIIRITNVGGKLLRRRFGEESQYEKDQKAKFGIEAEYETGIFADTEKENPFERMVLQDGVKVQIRLGYASNPDHLETVFLGSIVEMSPREDGKIIELVCQGFGAELEGVELGPLEDGPIFYSSQQVLSGAIIQDSIVNFGRRSRWNRTPSAEQRHQFTGGEGTGTLGQVGPSSVLRAWAEARQGRMSFKYPFRNYPQDDNIFAPPPAQYATKWMRFWNNACTYRPLKQTPWQVFKEHELRHPGYISLAVPYGHSPRMTMFFGAKGQHYWKEPPTGLEMFLAESAEEEIIRLRGLNKAQRNQAQFRQNLEKIAKENTALANAILKGVSSFSHPLDVGTKLGEIFGRYRPFRNYHYFDSSHHILKNSISTNRDGTFNEVEVLYFSDENDIEEDDIDELVTNLEQLSRGEAGLMACQLDENMPEEYIRSYREEFPSCVTDDMARRYVQGLFARLLRDSYKGELIVLGEPTLKPYDVCYLNDSSINMTGPIEVEQVEQIFNRDFGYISIITPDMCLDINDYYSATTFDLTAASMAYTFGLDNPDTALSLGMLASPLGTLAWAGGVKLIKHTQDGVPVIATPLVLNGKPMMSVAMGQKRGSLLLKWHGQWKQYRDDLATAWSKFDIAESMFQDGLDRQESLFGFFGAEIGESIPTAEPD
jgi:hypothetical protein